METLRICCVVFASVSFLLSFIFAYLNSFKVAGLYLSDNGEVDNKYFQQVSPVGTAFGIVWPIIYTWNLIAMIYLLVALCLPNSKSPVKHNPTLTPITFLIAYGLSFLITVGWLFAFDREILGLALALLILAVISIYIALGASYKNMVDNLPQYKNRVMLWCVRIIVQNGYSIFATWLTIATHLNLCDVILYQDSLGSEVANLRGIISIENASTVVLSILLVFILLWFALENFVFEKYCRYTFTIYPVFILAFSGLVAKLQPLDATRNLVFASVQLGVVVVLFIVRIALSVYRWKMRSRKISLHTDEKSASVQMENTSQN